MTSSASRRRIIRSPPSYRKHWLIMHTHVLAFQMFLPTPRVRPTASAAPYLTISSLINAHAQDEREQKVSHSHI